MSQKRILLAFVSGFLMLSLACDILSSAGGNSDSSGTSGSGTEQVIEDAAPTQKDGANPQSTAKPGKQQPTKEPIEKAPSSAKVGDVFRNGYLRMVVLGWMELEPTKNSKPETGNRFIIVAISAVNLWEDGLFQFDSRYFTIKDSESREYNKTVYLDQGGSSYNTSNIFPGDRWTGFIGFEIPEDSSGLMLVMNADDQNQFDRVLIELGEEQGIQDPPETIAGETPPDPQPVETPASCGKWNLQVNAVFVPTIDRNYADLITAGHKILLADLTLENTASESQTLSASNIFWLQDPLGLRYGQSFFAESVTGSQVQGKFFSYETAASAGETIRGWIGFDVPENVGNPYLVFWCGYLDSYDSVVRTIFALPTA